MGRTRPDAFLVYALGSRKLAALVEVDRGTERGEKWWADKLARFGEILTGGVFHELTGLKQGRVLVIAPTEARRHLRAAAHPHGALYGAGAGVRIAHKSVLEGGDLRARVWVRPDASGLHPLVAPDLL